MTNAKKIYSFPRQINFACDQLTKNQAISPRDQKFYWVLNVDNLDQKEFFSKLKRNNMDTLIDARLDAIFHYPKYFHKDVFIEIDLLEIFYISIHELKIEDPSYSSFRNTADHFLNMPIKNICILKSNSEVDFQFVQTARSSLDKRGFVERQFFGD